MDGEVGLGADEGFEGAFAGVFRAGVEAGVGGVGVKDFDIGDGGAGLDGDGEGGGLAAADVLAAIDDDFVGEGLLDVVEEEAEGAIGGDVGGAIHGEGEVGGIAAVRGGEVLEEGGGGDGGVAGVEGNAVGGPDIDVDFNLRSLGDGSVAGFDLDDGAGQGRGGGPRLEQALEAQEHVGGEDHQEDHPEEEDGAEGAEPARDLAAGNDLAGVHGVGMMDGLAHEDGDEFGRAAEGGVLFLGEFDGGGDAFLAVGKGGIGEQGGGGQTALAAEETAQDAVGAVHDDGPGDDGQGDAEPDGDLEAGAEGEHGEEPDGGQEDGELEEGVEPGEETGAAGDDAQRLLEALGDGRGLVDEGHGSTGKVRQYCIDFSGRHDGGASRTKSCRRGRDVTGANERWRRMKGQDAGAGGVCAVGRACAAGRGRGTICHLTCRGYLGKIAGDGAALPRPFPRGGWRSCSCREVSDGCGACSKFPSVWPVRGGGVRGDRDGGGGSVLSDVEQDGGGARHGGGQSGERRGIELSGHADAPGHPDV